MSYTLRQIKELLWHWNEELLHCIANQDMEGAAFARSKIAYWNHKRKRKVWRKS